MKTPESNPERERLDQATSNRLARLRKMDVSTAELQRAIEAQIPRHTDDSRRWKFSWFRPMQALAASLLLAGLIIVLIVNSAARPVLASPERLAQVYTEAAAGMGDIKPVNSFEDAKRELAAKWPDAPVMPTSTEDHVMSCCTHMMGNKKMACVTFQADGSSVTMAVWKSVEVKWPAKETIQINGMTCYVQSHNGVNMVMTERNSQGICLMGKLPTTRLAELASNLKF